MSDSRPDAFMALVKGRPASEFIKSAEHYFGISVDHQLAMHGVRADGMGSMAQKLRRQLEDSSDLSDRQRDILTDKLEAMRGETSLCHGDYHVFNLIMSETGVKIIDWVDASAGSGRADAYRSYLLYALFSEDIAGLYLEIYCKKSGVSKDEVLFWEPVFAGARLSEKIIPLERERLIETVARHVKP
ncbi:MAG: aminoglycoside phosphotransferase family protein, partial [Oscillospiraceae bacterium]|nr:aminoglycoside phosphotransferase family protein [Oscillospiraceae bacterium]